MPPLADLDLDDDERRTLSAAGITSCGELHAALAFHRLDATPGFGPGRRRPLLEALARTPWEAPHRDLLHARSVAIRVLSRLQQDPNALRLAPVGGVRRMEAVVESVDLLGTAHDVTALVDAFASLPFLSQVGETKGVHSAHMEDGTLVRLLVLPEAPPTVMWALVLHTGPASHLDELAVRAGERGITFAADGLRKDGELLPLLEEADLYHALGAPYVPPERRHAPIAAPAEHLLGMPHMRGLYRARSSHGGGTASIDHLARRATQEGYEYVVVADPWRDPENAAARRAEADTADGEVVLAALLPADPARWPSDDAAFRSNDLWIAKAGTPAACQRILEDRRIAVIRAPEQGEAPVPAGLLADAADRGLAIELAPYPHRQPWDATELARFVAAGGRLLPSAEMWALGHEDRALVAVAAARRLGALREQVPLSEAAGTLRSGWRREEPR